jgi:hypothetical protein
MKTLKEIAQTILERRARMNPTVMQGEMLNVLGEDGLSEALARRWLTPCYESGYLQVAGQEAAVIEMQEIAAMPDPTPEPDTLGESRTASLLHATRARASIMEASVISEIAAPATGRPSPSFSAPQMPASPTSAPPANPNAPYNIGDDAVVVENGKSYQGKVSSNQGGRYKISFGGGEQPAAREYAPNEISRVAPSNPGSSAPAPVH